jgi:hypothetical protein
MQRRPSTQFVVPPPILIVTRFAVVNDEPQDWAARTPESPVVNCENSGAGATIHDREIGNDK